jgi:hypothetical protein
MLSCGHGCRNILNTGDISVRDLDGAFLSAHFAELWHRCEMMNFVPEYAPRDRV